MLTTLPLVLSQVTEMINALDDDKDLLNMKGIAQSYYTDDEVVSDTANTNYETRRSYSDIVASINLAISNLPSVLLFSLTQTNLELLKKKTV